MKKGKRKWKEIYEFPDKNRAVCDGEDHLMLKQLPDLLTVMPARLKAEVCEWLFNKYPRLVLMLGKKTKQEIFEYLLNKEYKKEVRITS